MSKSNAFETAMLQLYFQNANGPANLGDATGPRGSATAGSIYFSLHTADPGEAGSQTTSECAYTSYARVAIVRSAVGFTVTNNQVFPAANVDFPAATGGTETATFYGIGTSTSGAGTLLWSGAISPTIAITTGVTPRLTTASNVAED